jgi:hypothetical protein
VKSGRGPVLKNARSNIDNRLSDLGSFGGLRIKFRVVDRGDVGMIGNQL